MRVRFPADSDRVQARNSVGMPSRTSFLLRRRATSNPEDVLHQAKRGGLQKTISLHSRAETNRARCFGLVVAITTEDASAPNVRIWAAISTSMSRSFGSAVGRPPCRDLAQSCAAGRRA